MLLSAEFRLAVQPVSGPQPPSIYLFFCGGGWGPEAGLTTRQNSVGQRHARRRPRRRTTPRRRRRRATPRKRTATTEEEDGDDEKERRRSFGPLYRCNVGIAFDCLIITHCPLTAANTSDLQLKGLGTAHDVCLLLPTILYNR